VVIVLCFLILLKSCNLYNDIVLVGLDFAKKKYKKNLKYYTSLPHSREVSRMKMNKQYMDI